jgi:hypothetical protein
MSFDENTEELLSSEDVANGHALIEFIVHGVLLSIVAIAGL